LHKCHALPGLIRRLIAAAMLLIGLAGAAMAQDEAATPEAVIETLLKEEARAEQFSSAFLQSVPLEQIEALLGQIRTTIGPPVTIARRGDLYEVTTQTYSMDVEIGLDGDGRVAGLRLHAPFRLDASIEDAAAALNQLPGEVSYLIVRDGEVLAEKDPDKSMAIGSSFKLAILALVKEKVERGEIGWDSVIPVDAHSLPTGRLQTFPIGSPVTVHTAAALMISISDNTATDMLLSLVGREAVAGKLGADFALKTREFFFLKGDAEARAAYLEADPAGKLELVESLAGQPMPPLNLTMPAHEAGIEWYLTAQGLCSLLAEVEDVDVASINPGVANRADWAHIAYKGGSETGVLNMSTLVTDEAGRKSCVVLTINDSKAVDENAASAAYAGVLKVLARN
jgi:beta-lactamase class A